MKKLIENKIKTKEQLLVYCDVFLMAERISQDQFLELVELINTTYQAA
jgi:hypothetical protein